VTESIDFCQRVDCWLIDDATMERILYGGRGVIHPASFPGIRDKVITIGSASKEYRVIGWRVGWVVGPGDILADVARVSITPGGGRTGAGLRPICSN
jgi:aspartate/methionine/tyrosine aminotransferase